VARLWSSGFELQTVGSAGGGSVGEWETTVGSPSINTTTKRTGAASLRCNPTAASAYLRHSLMTGTTTSAHVYLRAYVYIATLPSANTMLMGWIDTSPFGYGVRLRTDGKLAIGGTNSVLIGTASTITLSTGQWYRIELDYDDGTDLATCYVDGVSACTLSGADTFGGTQAMFGLFDSCTADVYFDDIAVNDNSGSVQNGLPGAGSIVHLKPNAAGDNSGFATAVGGTAGAANNYTRVSETTPDDLTTYNNTTVTGTTTIDDFNVDSSASAGIGSSDTVTLVQVGQRMGSNAATTASIVTRIKGQASGTTTESASLPVNVNGFRTHALASPYTYKLTAYTNPQTSTAWTPTTLDSMQIGYRGNVAQTTSRRISTIWALVEFVPSSNDHPVTGTGGMTLDATATNTTDRTKTSSGGMSLDASATKTTDRTVAATAQMTLSTSETHSNSLNDRTVTGTGEMTLSASAASSTNRTVASRAEMTLTARASSTSGDGANYVWSPDLHPTGPTDLEITIQARRDDDWRPAGDQILISKQGNTDGKRSWFVYVDADGGGDPALAGRPVLAWTPTGNQVDQIEARSTARPPVDPLGTVTLRVFLDTNNGAGGWSVTFETQDQNGNWIQLGNVISGTPTTSIYHPASVEDYEIGAREDGTQGHFKGRVYYAQIRDGRSGAILASPDFTIWPSGTQGFYDGVGQFWTVSSAARIVSSQQLTTVAIVGPLETGECTSYVDWSVPRTGIGSSCDYHPDPCCSYYEVRTVARQDGSLLVSDWVQMEGSDVCLTWDLNEHLIRSQNFGDPVWTGVGGLFNWDRDRPFTYAQGVSGGQFITSAPPGGRNLHLSAAVDSVDHLASLQMMLSRPLVLVSPSDADEVWAAPVASSIRVVKIGHITQVTADFIATGPQPQAQHADVGV